MRRGSITGPIILILIGGVFLLNNLQPNLSLVGLLGDYWPFLLIAWGFLRLIEVAVTTRGAARPAPGTGISGGEWTMIILICLVGSGFFFAKNHHGAWPARFGRGFEVLAESFDYSIAEKTLQTGKSPHILIENFRGNVRVVGSDRSEVRVSGRKSIRALNQMTADNSDRSTQLVFEVQPDLVVIRTNQERGPEIGGVSTDLDIMVPKGANLESHGRLGDFEASDVNGNVEVTSDNAGVRVQNVGGLRVDLRRSDLVRASNVKGPVELKGHGTNVELDTIEGPVLVSGSYVGELEFRKISKPLRYEGEQAQFHVERCPGEIHVARSYINAINFMGPTQITARTKDIQLSDFSQSIELRIDHGDVDLRASKTPLSKMDVRTRQGNIELSLADSAKFDLSAEVQRGEVNNEYGAPLELQTAGRGATLRGRVGEGPTLTLSSDRGAVTVRKGSGSESAPVQARPSEPPLPPANSKISEIPRLIPRKD